MKNFIIVISSMAIGFVLDENGITYDTISYWLIVSLMVVIAVVSTLM